MLDKKAEKKKIRKNENKQASRRNEKDSGREKGKKSKYKQPPAENLKRTRNAGSSGKTELDLLIDKARNIKKKEELVALYKKINSKYESSSIETQAKFYTSIMDIYKRISKLK